MYIWLHNLHIEVVSIGIYSIYKLLSDSPISSISGAILNVIPTNSKHMINNKQAVAIIVHRARCGRSSGSIT